MRERRKILPFRGPCPPAMTAFLLAKASFTAP
jgi:hypothetical protein